MLLPFLGFVTGTLLLINAAALLPPLLIAYTAEEEALLSITLATAAQTLLGAVLMRTFGKLQGRLRVRDGFVLVSFTWVVMSLLGAMPLMWGLGMAPLDALLESVSGFTTTGATMLTRIEGLPKSILMYRQEIQWLGGIGMVVSAIALFPKLGIGGMQLLKAETPGPVKSEKLRPRLKETARSIIGIYVAITAACAGAYWLAGMPAYDAIAHSFSTVSTGGFSTHDDSLGYFDSTAIEVVAMLFMLVGSINFSLHYFAFRRAALGVYWNSEEVRALIGVIAVVTALVTLMLASRSDTEGTLQALRLAGFQVISVVTSTGFATANFSTWPLFVPVLLIFISFIGGCAGSTAGGMKVLRFVVLGRQAAVEIRRLYHPHLVAEVTLGNRVVPADVVQAVWAYCAIYVTVFAVTMVILMFDGMDQVTAFGAIATCLNNLGPGLGEVAQNFSSVSDAEKWVLCAAMLLGRLELFTIFVLFMPKFWQD
ncbi:MAG: potassium transporter [Gammaproteobacteria bacterium]|nr:MAG: potassium transporter [Gammaproteobacteria bacterium]